MEQCWPESRYSSLQLPGAVIASVGQREPSGLAPLKILLRLAGSMYERRILAMQNQWACSGLVLGIKPKAPTCKVLPCHWTQSLLGFCVCLWVGVSTCIYVDVHMHFSSPPTPVGTRHVLSCAGLDFLLFLLLFDGVSLCTPTCDLLCGLEWPQTHYVVKEQLVLLISLLIQTDRTPMHVK